MKCATKTVAVKVEQTLPLFGVCHTLPLLSPPLTSSNHSSEEFNASSGGLEEIGGERGVQVAIKLVLS